jgi:hypothetical protein
MNATSEALAVPAPAREPTTIAAPRPGGSDDFLHSSGVLFVCFCRSVRLALGQLNSQRLEGEPGHMQVKTPACPEAATITRPTCGRTGVNLVVPPTWGVAVTARQGG